MIPPALVWSTSFDVTIDAPSNAKNVTVVFFLNSLRTFV